MAVLEAMAVLAFSAGIALNARNTLGKPMLGEALVLAGKSFHRVAVSVVPLHRRSLSGMRFGLPLLTVALSLLAVDRNRHLDRVFVFLFAHVRNPVAPTESKAVGLLGLHLAFGERMGFDLDFDTVVVAIGLSGFTAIITAAIV